MARPKAVDISADAREFVHLLGKMSPVEPKLKAGLRKQLRAGAADAAKDVKTEVLKPPLHQASRMRNKGLRRGIAAGVKVQVATGASSARVGVFIRASGSKLGGSRAKLVRRWDRGSFRHPVFGNRDVWVTQSGRPYFGSVIRKRQDHIRDAVIRALEEARNSLTD